MNLRYLIAVKHLGGTARGVIFDMDSDDVFVVAWGDGELERVYLSDLVFVRFLSSEIEANEWLREDPPA